MRKFITEKMLHKKWMTICLLLGNVLLLGIAMSNPLYYHAALNRTLQQYLNDAEMTRTSDAGEVLLQGRLVKDKESGLFRKQFYKGDYKDPDKVSEQLAKDFDLPLLASSQFYSFPTSKIESMTMGTFSQSDKFMVSYLSELEEHIDMVSGSFCSDETDMKQAIPCVVNEHTMMNRRLMVGQEITLQDVKDEDGNSLTLRIEGIFKEKEDDPYWMEKTDLYTMELFVSDAFFQYCLDHVRFISGNYTELKLHTAMDITAITDYNYKRIQSEESRLAKFFKGSSDIKLFTGFSEPIKEYKKNRGNVHTVMLILQVPLFILLALFIYMVSKQMLSMEENEVAMLKSRGASRKQILMMYVIQSSVISGIAALLGIPLAIFLSKMIGSANSFLQFVSRSNMSVHFSFDVLLYLLVAMAFSIGMMVLPVIATSKLTIVEYKQEHKKKKKPLWKRWFLDVILLAFTTYIYYNFLQQKETLSFKIAQGGDIDYMLLMSSALFILGMGFLFIRIVPALVYIVFSIGKRFWNPEMYASFLQIIRTSEKQEMISLFLVMTIALGIFNAAAASTVNQNMEDEIRFANGADIVLKERFDSNYYEVRRQKDQGGDNARITYEEADYEKYNALKEQVDTVTRVYHCNDVTFGANELAPVTQNFSYMGIEPKSFGETCYFRNDLMKKHWYHYLNLLSENYYGVLVSKAAAEQYNLKVGQEVYMEFADELDCKDFLHCNYMKIVGVVDYFPTRSNEEITMDDKGKVTSTPKYYIIGNFDFIMGELGVQEYNIYIKTRNHNTEPVYQFIEEQSGVYLKEFKDTNNEILIKKNDPMLQVTNGILTISFLVVIVLCTAGFLIYWTLSIRERELLFGIYRAMGLSKGELKKMLINEHFFSTLLSIVAGALIGVVTSLLFVPVMEITYLPGAQIIPMKMVLNFMDMAKLGGVVLGMVLVCILVLMRLVSRLNISQALKLGED